MPVSGKNIISNPLVIEIDGKFYEPKARHFPASGPMPETTYLIDFFQCKECGAILRYDVRKKRDVYTLVKEGKGKYCEYHEENFAERRYLRELTLEMENPPFKVVEK